MSNKFKTKYLSKLAVSDVNVDYSYIESKLSSPRKTVIAILVFGCLLGIVHIFKIIIFISEKDELYRLPDDFLFIDFFNVTFLFINWCMSISIIPKLNKVRGDEFNNKLTDNIKARIISYYFKKVINFKFIYHISQIYIFSFYKK